MLDYQGPALRNSLISDLRSSDIQLFKKIASPVELNRGQILEVPQEPIRQAYFLEDGILSVEAMTRAGHSMQVAMIGREGVSGTALALGGFTWPHMTVVHIDATAWEIPAEKFHWFLSTSTRVRNSMLRYTGVLAAQIASTAIASGRSTILERLSRWICQMSGRIDGGHFEVTHEEIAEKLGVRRSGITDALHILEGQHLILSRRGQVEVIDRPGLVLASGGCYRDGD
jgi:CRP-like cAMP-binding protein